MRANEVIARAKFNIEKELEYCDKVDTPYICEMIKTPKGRKQVIDTILGLVALRGFSISMAIAEQERLLNPRYSSN